MLLCFCRATFKWKHFRKLLTSQSCRRYSGLELEALEDSINKTTIELSSRTPNMHPLLLTGYGVGMFKFGNTTIRDSVAIIDKAVFSWKISDPNEITFESLAMFYLMHPKLDIVIIGTGNNYRPLQPSIIEEMKGRGIAVETQDTIHACGTYNLLKMERPTLVGAALLPITQQVSTKKMIHKGGRYQLE